MIHNPAEDVVAFMDGETVNARVLAAGTNLFACEPRVGPDDTYPLRCVFVWEASGPAPMPYLGVSRSVWYPRVQVRVRGDGAADSMQEGRLTARAVIALLHRAQISGYVSVLANESAPIPLGEGKHGAYEFGLNFDLIFGE